MAFKKKNQKTEDVVETIVKEEVQSSETVEKEEESTEKLDENINNNKPSEEEKESMTESQIKEKIETAVKQTKETVEKVKTNIEVITPLLNKNERAFIFDLISKGYHVKDILARVKVKLNLSAEVYAKLSNNVITTDNLLKNMGIM